MRMLKIEFDPEVANKIPDVAVFRDHHDRVCQIFAVNEFNSFVNFLDDGYDTTLAEIFARNFSKSLEEYDYLEGVALRALEPVKGHYSTIFDSYFWGSRKMSASQRDFREEQIIRSYNNVMMNVSADLAQIVLGLRDKPIPRPCKSGEDKKSSSIMGCDFDTKNLLAPHAADRLKGEDDQTLMAAMTSVQELFVKSIYDQASYLSFLDGDLVVELAHEFADQEAVDQVSYERLYTDANFSLEQIRIKHNSHFLIGQETCDDNAAFLERCIGHLKYDLQAVGSSLAIMAIALDDKKPTERPYWGPHLNF